MVKMNGLIIRWNPICGTIIPISRMTGEMSYLSLSTNTSQLSLRPPSFRHFVHIVAVSPGQTVIIPSLLRNRITPPAPLVSRSGRRCGVPCTGTCRNRYCGWPHGMKNMICRFRMSKLVMQLFLPTAMWNNVSAGQAGVQDDTFLQGHKGCGTGCLSITAATANKETSLIPC
jgi:hypothetical protein